MILNPTTVAQLAELLASASSKTEKIERVDLSALNRILQHTPEDMTVTVEAGVTLATLQAELARHRQWLPLDPPHAERLTIGELIDANPSGPRRFAHGTIRDYLLGITVVLADGTVIHNGGNVVKNVAGYDLAKLFVGAQGSLGVVVEATFKLRPLPEREEFIEARCDSLEQAGELIEAVIKSELTPVVFDLHNQTSLFTLVLGFAGSREEVEWQLALARTLDFDQPSSLDHDEKFRGESGFDAAPFGVPPLGGSGLSDRLKAGHQAGNPVRRLSVLPSKIIEAIRGLNGAPFVARAGNGVIYHRSAATPLARDLPLALTRRLKDAYDPRHILPDLPL